MVNIGIIGLGASWDTRYAPVLKKLRDRIRIRAIYDPVASRAEQVAAEWSATPVSGVLNLLGRKEVAAVLLLDTAWHGHKTLEFSCNSKKPIYIAGEIGSDLDKLKDLYETGRAAGLTLMPEMSQRHTPASGRLQELMATQLGKPKKIVVDAKIDATKQNTIDHPSAEFYRLVELVDWCRYIARAPAKSVLMADQTSQNGPSSTVRRISVEFASSRREEVGAVAELNIHSVGTSAPTHETDSTTSRMQYAIHCQRGRATIEKATEISWQADAGPVVESLTSDRSEVEVMLDHFCRRVVGGLIPVADLNDICKGIHTIQAAEESLRRGTAVSLNGRL